MSALDKIYRFKESVIWKGEEIKIPFYEDDTETNKINMFRFSNCRDDVISLFIDFCDRHALKIYMEEFSGKCIEPPMSPDDLRKISEDYLAASLLSAQENIQTWNTEWVLRIVKLTNEGVESPSNRLSEADEEFWDASFHQRIGLSLYGFESRYSLLLFRWDKEAGDEVIRVVSGLEECRLTSVVSRAMACI